MIRHKKVKEVAIISCIRQSRSFISVKMRLARSVAILLDAFPLSRTNLMPKIARMQRMTPDYAEDGEMSPYYALLASIIRYAYKDACPAEKMFQKLTNTQKNNWQESKCFFESREQVDRFTSWLDIDPDVIIKKVLAHQVKLREIEKASALSVK